MNSKSLQIKFFQSQIQSRSQADSASLSTGVKTARALWNNRSMRLILALILTYVVATCLPAPGVWLHGLVLEVPVLALQVTVSNFVLACLLFCAGLTVETARMPRLSASLLSASMLTTWLLPATIGGLACLICAQLQFPTHILLGMIIAVSMPIANSTVGWTHLAGGNLPLAFALVLVGTISAPFIAPLLMQFLIGNLLDPNILNTALIPVRQLSLFLALWVVLPAMCGLATGLYSRHRGVVWSARWLRTISIGCLLLLNYLNASTALPHIRDEELVLLALGGILFVNLATVWGAWLVLRSLKISTPVAVAVTLACGMRNTGVALVLTGSQFQLDPVVVMTILIHTLVQHLVAGILTSSVTRHTALNGSSIAADASTAEQLSNESTTPALSRRDLEDSRLPSAAH